MIHSYLKLVSPATVNPTVRPKRPPNRTLRTREYLTEAEVEQLMAAARQNRWGHRDATMLLVAYRHGLRVSELVKHPQIQEWRKNFEGIQFLHTPTNLIVTGAVDVTIDADWQLAHKRQMKAYQRLLRQQGLTVSNTGYFVYCNGQDAEAFDGRIEFVVKLPPYTGSGCWIEGVLVALKSCLLSTDFPDKPADREFCGLACAAEQASRVD